jgi:hypothetical protein
MNFENSIITGLTIDGEDFLVGNSHEGAALTFQDISQFVTRIEIDMSLNPDANGFLRAGVNEASNFHVNYSDGKGEFFKFSTTVIEHQYDDPNFKGWLFIYGQFKGLDLTQLSDEEKKVIVSVQYDDNVTVIPENAFVGCPNLKQVKLSDSTTFIGCSAFSGCSSLELIKLPILLEEIPEKAFECCSKLTHVELGENIKHIGNRAFAGCSSLKRINLSKDLEEIGDYAFYQDERLEIGSIPSNVSKVGDYALYSLQQDCIVFDSVEPPEIGEHAIPAGTKTIFVPTSSLVAYKEAYAETYAYMIYPNRGYFSETITIPVDAWADNTAKVSSAGATREFRNTVDWVLSLAQPNVNSISLVRQENLFLTFTAETTPTEEVSVDVRFTLTNF